MSVTLVDSMRRDPVNLALDATVIGSSTFAVKSLVSKYFSPVGIYNQVTTYFGLVPLSHERLKQIAPNCPFDELERLTLLSKTLETAEVTVLNMENLLKGSVGKVVLPVYTISAIDATFKKERRAPHISLLGGALGGALISRLFPEPVDQAWKGHVALGIGAIAGAVFGLLGNLMGQALRSVHRGQQDHARKAGPDEKPPAPNL